MRGFVSNPISSLSDLLFANSDALSVGSETKSGLETNSFVFSLHTALWRQSLASYLLMMVLCLCLQDDYHSSKCATSNQTLISKLCSTIIKTSGTSDRVDDRPH